MICKKISELDNLPASCSCCPFFDEALYQHGGIVTGQYLSCSMLPGVSLGCAAADKQRLSACRSKECPLLNLT